MDHFLRYVPSRCSTKSLEHFAQLMENKEKAEFTHFDYGEEENMKKYGQKDAPEYDL